MARPKSDRPAYLLHKQSGRARVVIDGKQKLLPGLYDSPESRAAYDVLVGTWLTNGRALPVVAEAPTGPTVAMIALAFWKHASTFYVDAQGQPTGEAVNFKYALRPLRRLYGATPAAAFGPKSLKALRAAMLLRQPDVDPQSKKPKLDAAGQPLTRPGWSRNYANRQTDRVKRVFRWAASEELIPAAAADALDTVEAIRKGREGARETEPVKPVASVDAEAVLPHVSAQVGAMIGLQLLAGMRPGEVVIMRGIDLDTTGDVWIYTPPKHKTEGHGHGRTVYLGPRAQEVIRPFLKPDLTAHLFSPADAERARQEARHAARKTPLSCGNRPAGGKPRRAFRSRYSVLAYYRAIERACDRAFPVPAELADKPAELLAWRKAHRWHPHQLRHSAATMYRREGDFETAKIVIGHKTDSMTQLYAERDTQKAREIVARIG
jgi:integrase